MFMSRKLASKSILIFGMRIFGAGFIFIAQAAIARVWGAEILGDFLLVTAASSLLGVIIPLGFQTIGTFFSAEYGARNEGNNLRRFLTHAYGHILVMGVIIVLWGMPLTHLLGEGGSHVANYWLPTSLIACAIAFNMMNMTTLVGLQRPFSGYLPDMVARPILTMCAFLAVVMLFPSPDLNRMLWFVAIGLWSIYGLQFLRLMQAVRAVPNPDAYRKTEYRRWWHFAMPWMVVTLTSDYFFDINILVLAELFDKSELAIFGVSTRIFALMSFGVAAVHAIILPELFKADADKDPNLVKRKLREANYLSVAISVALTMGVFFFGPFLLSLFGNEFVAGASAVTILCSALVVRAIFGPATMVLSMRNRPWASVPAVVLGVVVLMIGNYVLVPIYHLNGAAIAAFIAVSVWSAGLWLIALKLTGINVSVFSRFNRGGSNDQTTREV